MNNFYQTVTVTYDEAKKRLNSHLSGLELVNVQNSMSGTKFLYLTIYSKKHDADYSLSLGTNKWVWKNGHGIEVPILRTELDDNNLQSVTDVITKVLQNKPKIKKIELSEKSKLIQVHFEDGSVIEAQEDLLSEVRSYYQLRLIGSKLYQNYNLTTQDNTWYEEIMFGEEYRGEYRVSMFDLDYFRTEHRHFTAHAIKQARERKSPISFLQANVLYRALTTSDEFLFSLWKLRRSSIKRTRLDTIPTEELITISKEECNKNNFTIEEAKDILKSTIVSFKEWIRTEKNLDIITDQEYGTSSNFNRLIKWYEETI